MEVGRSYFAQAVTRQVNSWTACRLNSAPFEVSPNSGQLISRSKAKRETTVAGQRARDDDRRLFPVMFKPRLSLPALMISRPLRAANYH